MATTTTSPNMGPRMNRTSNTPLYWGVAILAAVIIAIALFMRPTRVVAPTAVSDGMGTTSQAVNTVNDTTPPTNALQQQQVVDPATGRSYTTDPATGTIVQPDQATSTRKDADVNGMAVDPRAEQLHNGANSTNGGINPNANPASQTPNAVPTQQR